MLYIEFVNSINFNIVCKINNEQIYLKNDKNGNAFANIELPKGKYSLTIANRSLYNSPFCYFNIINPVFYIFQLRFLEHNLLKSRNDFSSTIIIFNITNDYNSKISFNFSLFKDFSSFQHRGIKISAVDNENIDTLQIKRYKFTYIFSNIFYMIILNMLSLATATSKDNFIENIIFCILITLFSFFNIIKLLKTLQSDGKKTEH